MLPVMTLTSTLMHFLSGVFQPIHLQSAHGRSFRYSHHSILYTGQHRYFYLAPALLEPHEPFKPCQIPVVPHCRSASSLFPCQSGPHVFSLTPIVPPGQPQPLSPGPQLDSSMWRRYSCSWLCPLISRRTISCSSCCPKVIPGVSSFHATFFPWDAAPLMGSAAMPLGTAGPLSLLSRRIHDTLASQQSWAREAMKR